MFYLIVLSYKIKNKTYETKTTDISIYFNANQVLVLGIKTSTNTY